MLLTRSPLTHPPENQRTGAFDLHVLSTPPAFVLSQDQTLRTKNKARKRTTHPPPNTTARKKAGDPNQKTQKQNRHKNKTNCRQTNTLSSSQTTPTQTHTHGQPMSTGKENNPTPETTHPEPRDRGLSAQRRKQYPTHPPPSNHTTKPSVT